MLCKIGLHSWKKIYEPVSYKFMDDYCIKKVLRFRVCSKCKKMQKLDYTIDGCFWNTLNDCERKIVKRHIARGDLSY